MGAPTVDSMNPPSGADITEGPGSKTPTPSPLAAGGPIGGGSSIKPAGAPGAPGKDQPGALDSLDEDTFGTLVDDIYTAIDDEKVESETVEEVLDYLLNNSWSEKRLLKLSKYLKSSIRDMIFSVMKHVKKDGVNDTIDLIKGKVKDIQEEEGIPEGAAPPVPGPEASMGLPPIGLPPIGADDRSNSKKITDVDLNIINKRGFNMGKIIVKEGAVVDSAVYAKEIINKISTTTRKVKTSMKELDELKMKYAGALALKKAVESTDMMAGGMGAGLGAGAGAGMPADAGPVGPEEASGGVDNDNKESLEEIKEMVGDIKESLEEIKEDVSEKKDELGADIGEAEKAIGEGKDVLEKDDLGGLEPDEADEVEEKAAAAREVIKEAKKKVREDIFAMANFFDKFKKKDKKDDKDEKKDDKKDDKKDKEDKKDDKKDKKEDKKDDKKSSIDVDTLLQRVKARLEELRTEKEANLYPFKKEVKPIPKVDNINSETAKKEISTVDSEIKKQPVTDKKYENINPEEAYADLSVSNEKGTKGEKKVSIEVAERIRNHSVQNAVDKARLSVELAARQQLKGLIEDPLRIALAKNMIESGAEPELAEAIIHNAYIDAFEKSQKAVMKEAFETFMEKDIDEFVKVAKFVDEYVVKTGSIGSVENVEETFRDKEASTSAPLRGFSADKDSQKVVFKNYWQDVARKRGIVP